MKKISTLLLLLVCLLSSLTFAGCKNDNIIDPSVYMNQSVTANIYGVSSSEQIDTTLITSKNPGAQKKYINHQIKLNKEWIHGIYVETITYYIYSNKNMEDVEFDLTLTGTENGEVTLTNATRTFKHLKQPYTLSANKGYKVTVTVNDKIKLSSSDSILTISLSDTTTDPGFEYSIYGLEIVAYHK